MGISLSNGQVEYTLNKLYNPYTGKGLLKVLEMTCLVERVNGIHKALDQLMFDSGTMVGNDLTVTTRLACVSNWTYRICVRNMLSEMSKNIAGFAEKTEDPSRRTEMMGIAKRLLSLADELKSWLSFADEGMVYWLERSQTRRGNMRIEICTRLANRHQRPLARKLFQKVPSVIKASADHRYRQQMPAATAEPTQSRSASKDHH